MKKGFTLIELMIVVAIISILATIAVPSYQGYIERARDTAAQAFLKQLALAQEMCNIDKASYVDIAHVSVLTDYGFRPDPDVAFTMSIPVATEGTGFVAYAAHNSISGKIYIYNSMRGGAAPYSITEPGTAILPSNNLLIYTITPAGAGITLTAAKTAVTIGVDIDNADHMCLTAISVI